MRNILITLFFLSFTLAGFTQELNCRVSINSQQVQISDKSKFQTLQKEIYEFMNNRQWTDRKFEVEERIECSIYITFDKSTSGDYYKGTIQVQSSRPVYRSSYNSIMLNLMDKDLAFTWVEHDPLDFDLNSFTNNLTSVLAYYAYIIIGFDFDSFSPSGGIPYFNNAQTIVNNAQNAREPGWKSFEGQKNRYWFVENLLNSSYADFHDFMYQYHRQGLDLMYESTSKARVNILKALESLQKLHRNRPGLYITSTLVDAKRDEFIGIFSGAQPNERTAARKIFAEIDPAHVSEYDKMMSGGK